jgi:hypothetical protein
LPLPIEKREDRKRLADAETVGVRVAELEEELAALRAAYEQYFLGVERRPPTDQHEKFKKALKDLRNNFVRHTGTNFKMQGLQQKYLTYERLWTRTLQEIEAGTYKRDVFKAKRRAHELEQRAKKKKANGTAVNPDATPPESDPLGAHPEDAPGGHKPPPPPPDEEFLDENFDDDDAPPPPPPAASSKPSLAAVQPLPSGVMPLKPGQAISKTGLPAVAPVQPVSKPGTPTQGAQAVSRTGLPPVGPPSKPGLQPVVPPGAPARPTTQPPVAAKPGAPAAPAGPPRITANRPESVSAPMVKGAAPAAASGDLSEKKIKAIYDAYVMAKKRCNEDVSKLSVDSLATTLRKQVPELMKQHGAKSVEFKVVIKDGKAILRALPKNE